MTLPQFSYFDDAHWQRVLAARQAQGLNRLSEQDKRLAQHPLASARLRHRETGQVWRVLEVRQEWRQGYYRVATLECDGVQQECVVENLSSYRPETNIELARYLKAFQVLSVLETDLDPHKPV